MWSVLRCISRRAPERELSRPRPEYPKDDPSMLRLVRGRGGSYYPWQSAGVRNAATKAKQWPVKKNPVPERQRKKSRGSEPRLATWGAGGEAPRKKRAGG